MYLNKENMPELYYFLESHIPAEYDYDVVNEEVVVGRYLVTVNLSDYERILKEFEEVLSWDFFPYKEISDLSDLWFETQQEACAWFKRMYELLKKGKDEVGVGWEGSPYYNIPVDAEEIYQDSMPELHNFLLSYIPSDYEYHKSCEQAFIERYLRRTRHKRYKKLLKQCEKVLSWKSFPHQTVCILTNTSFNTPEESRDWLVRAYEFLKNNSDKLEG